MSDSSSSSTSAFVSSLVFNFAIFCAFIGLFLCLRPREKHVYQPRCIIDTQPKEEKPEPSPSSPFGLFAYVVKRSETYLIQYAGVDGYFFIRYLFTFGALCILGCLVLFPILLPVNATNGVGEKGFDILSFSNVKNHNRFYAHVFLSWLFFGFTIFIIYRELRYYVIFRHAMQSSGLYNNLPSSSTMLLTELPNSVLNDEETLHELFPNASEFTFVRDLKKLEKKVKKRSDLGNKYESTLNSLINKSVKKHNKLVKKHKPLPSTLDYTAYVKKRPTHRLKFLIGKKVDTIDYCRDTIAELDEVVDKLQTSVEERKKVGSVFIRFRSQTDLQTAYQAFLYSKKFRKYRFGRALVGIAPEDIVWSNLDLSMYTRRGKKTISNTILTLMIIFWAFPVAVVGCISNVNYLIEKVHFLKFIDNMPPKLLGIITGILPSVALSILMSLVPPFIKFLGKFGGALTVQEIENYCQNWYYAFQVVQVFLVTTMTSAATSAVVQVIKEPASSMTLLASNLPKASNFYISYFLLQGLSIPGGALLQIVTLLLSKVLGRIFDNTPRKKWNRWNQLSAPSWGTVYPVYSLLVTIMICYSIIAPIIIGFAAVAFVLIYFAYSYNLIYVLGHNADAKGRNYPRALFQVFVGLYLAEVCLIGLFVLAKNWGATVLEAVFLGFTVACHLYFKYKFLPLMDAVPISAIESVSERPEIKYPMDLGTSEMKNVGRAYPEILEKLSSSSGSDEFLETSSRTSENTKEKIDKDDEGFAITNISSVHKMPSFVLSYFSDLAASNRILTGFDRVLQLLPSFYDIPVRVRNVQYVSPALKATPPSVWIPKDPLGLSTYAIEDARGKVDIFDDNTTFNEKGNLQYTGPPPDYDEAIRS
ncbi:Extracellular tail, of 10TM putative phosphate transporter [Schizosaccharomyces pombe]